MYWAVVMNASILLLLFRYCCWASRMAGDRLFGKIKIVQGFPGFFLCIATVLKKIYIQ